MRRARLRCDRSQTLTSHKIREHGVPPDHVSCWPRCGRPFPNASKLQAHMITHTGKYKYPCKHPGCGKGFPDKTKYNRHMANHSNQRPHKCKHPGCNKSFKVTDQMNKHFGGVHEGKRRKT